MRKRTGFTLLELIVVMGIMVIITAASVPSFMKFTKTARLRAGARDITTALRTARRLAITTRITRAVTVYLDDYTTPSGKNTVTFYETADTIKTQRAAANIYFTDDNDPDAGELTFTFSPRGTTGANTIRVVDPNGRYIRISVTAATGRVNTGDILE